MAVALRPWPSKISAVPLELVLLSPGAPHVHGRGVDVLPLPSLTNSQQSCVDESLDWLAQHGQKPSDHPYLMGIGTSTGWLSRPRQHAPCVTRNGCHRVLRLDTGTYATVGDLLRLQGIPECSVSWGEGRTALSQLVGNATPLNVVERGLFSMLHSRHDQLAEDRWLTGSAQADLIRDAWNGKPSSACLADQLDGSQATPDHATAVEAVGISDKAWSVARILGTGLFVVVHRPEDIPLLDSPMRYAVWRVHSSDRADDWSFALRLIDVWELHRFVLFPREVAFPLQDFTPGMAGIANALVHRLVTTAASVVPSDVRHWLRKHLDYEAHLQSVPHSVVVTSLSLGTSVDFGS